MAYERIAAVYDGLMNDIDYEAWANYLHELLMLYKVPGQKLLDLGCGTGNITLRLAQKGWQITAVDQSAEMLAKAQAKSDTDNVCWQEGNITLMDFEGYDGVIATFDVFNYLLEAGDLQDLLQNLAMGLNDNGLLIFDINTPFKLRNFLGNNIYTYHSEEMVYLWENQFDEEADICQMRLTFFVQEESSGLYEKWQEFHEQKVYEPKMLTMWLTLAGFDVLAIYEALSMDELSVVDKEHKIVFVARKAW